MEWFFLPWTFTAYLNGTFDPAAWHADRGHRYEPPGPADAWLIEIVYETLAAETRCRRCGAPLEHPHLRADAWPVRVTTRCRGMARHRHRADVIRDPGGLRINPLTRA